MTLTIALLVAALLIGLLILRAADESIGRIVQPAAVRSGRRIGRLSPDAAWCWFADPRAVHHAGRHRRTYIGWVNQAGDIVAAAYDHVTADLTTVTLRPGLEYDDHANPAILVRPDGWLTVFYSAHNGSRMFYRVSSLPEDIGDWGEERSLPANTQGRKGYTYPNPMVLSAESDRLYLFWRGGDWSADFATSDDMGQAWSPVRTLVRVDEHRPYIKYASDGRSRIHFAFTDGHPRNLFNNIYHAYYEGGTVHRADGTPIRSLAELPLSPPEADRVYDAQVHGAHAWIWDIALDAAGRPVIVYATFPSVTNHRYRYARWTGSAWEDHEVCPAGRSIDGPSEVEYSGGIVLDHADPSRVYLSREVNGIHEIERRTTPDGGATWTVEPITADSALKNVRPFVPRNAADEMSVLWMQGDYPHYTQYRTALLAWPMGDR